MTTPTFSLTREPWIPVVEADGGSRLVSLREFFDGHGSITGLECDSPSQEYAVLRVILTIFIRAHARSSDWDLTNIKELNRWREDMWGEALECSEDPTILNYLNEFEERFDLLHPTTPFMQVAGLHTPSGSTLPTRRLIPEAEDDYFAMRSGPAAERLEFAEAARWLIHMHAFDYSGIKPGVVGDPRVKGGKSYPVGTGWTGSTGGTTIVGRTMQETLLLNSPDTVFLESPGDLPVWERDPDGPGPRAIPTPQGACDLMTWQTRRVLLLHDGNHVIGCVITNGDKIPDAGANVMNDPMTPYRYSTNKSTKDSDVFYAQPYSPERTMWRSLEPLIGAPIVDPTSGKGKPGKQPENLRWLAQAREHFDDVSAIAPVRMTSMVYGPQAATIAHSLDARLDVPLAALHPDNDYARVTILTAAKAALESGVAMGRFAGSLLQAAGGDYAFQPTTTDAYLAGQEQAFRRWLRELPITDSSKIDASLGLWQTALFTAAEEYADVLTRGAGPRALIGRVVSHDERQETYSAATALARLRRNLAKELPLARQSATEPRKNS